MDFSDDGLVEERRAILEAALPLARGSGWSEATLKKAAAAVGVPSGIAAIAFSEGAADLLHFWSQELDLAVLEALAAKDLTTMKVRERVTLAVRLRIELMAEHREAACRAMTFLALPHNVPLAARLAYGTADAIWHGLRDSSTDWNYYSKRAILSAVLTSTYLFWLGDHSEGFVETWGFLDRRIEDVMAFEKGKARLRDRAARLPSPFAILDGLGALRR
jgi:ubiquinone biosynthesis protein COQ9